ncbi:GNAT family N-acetyltransferase [Companilactobacillus furfuricola]|uniref:GNAT family N-acetyltransferase n=1 Tax=Companilactobacillus furfuricola TaxID=1462575 RepID=UPI0013DE01FA|nr:GNAT family N-acetyltransferase [Companilactobacillus furfuricola]
MKNYVIKKTYGATDFNAIKEVYYRTWQASLGNLVPQGCIQKLEEFDWDPDDKIGSTLIAVSRQNEIIGISAFGPSRNQYLANYGEIYSLYVLPEWQNLGVGKNLMARSLPKLDRVFDSVFLSVLSNNVHAQSFYENFGFNKTEYFFNKITDYGVLQEDIYIR